MELLEERRKTLYSGAQKSSDLLVSSSLQKRKIGDSLNSFLKFSSLLFSSSSINIINSLSYQVEFFSNNKKELFLLHKECHCNWAPIFSPSLKLSSINSISAFTSTHLSSKSSSNFSVFSLAFFVLNIAFWIKLGASLEKIFHQLELSFVVFTFERKCETFSRRKPSLEKKSEAKKAADFLLKNTFHSLFSYMLCLFVTITKSAFRENWKPISYTGTSAWIRHSFSNEKEIVVVFGGE